MNFRINTLIVETAGGCNLKCKMYPTTSYTVGKSLMGYNFFERILGIIKKSVSRSVIKV